MNRSSWQPVFFALLGAFLSINALRSQILAKSVPESASSRIDGSILQLISEREKSEEQAAILAKKSRLDLRGDSVGINMLLTSADVQINTLQLQQLGVRDFLRVGRWASGYVPILSIPELSQVPGIRFITRSADIVHTDVISEGVAATNATSYHDEDILGAGAVVTILDTEFGDIEDAIAAGEFGFPSVINQECTTNYALVPPASGTSAVDIGADHGTRVAQIVHDMAPEATLCLKIIGNLFSHYTLAIQDAIDEGSKVIIDSLNIYGASYYDGTGPYSETASSATISGEALYISSAGNDRLRHWRGSFFLKSENMDKDEDGVLEFSHAPFDESNTSLVNAEGGETIVLRMTWDDWPQTNIDYNVHLLKGADCLNDYKSIQDVVARQKEVADVPQDESAPFEVLSYDVPPLAFDNYCFVVTKAETSSAPDAEITLIWTAKDGEDHVEIDDFDPEYKELAYSVGDPAAGDRVLSVAASSIDDWPAGIVAGYSSEGPRNRSKFTAVQITKPDVTAPTDVSVLCQGAFCEDMFGGTSGAAPHVAGCAALLLSGNPLLEIEELHNILENQALDILTSGKDNRSGRGLLDCTYPGSSCSDDTFETDDVCSTARAVSVGSTQAHKHCDEDWIQFQAVAGSRYEIVTSNLAGGADTLLQLYGDSCATFLEENSDDGFELGASLISFEAPATGVYQIRIQDEDESYGDGQSYDILVTCIEDCPSIADLSLNLNTTTSPASIGDILTWAVSISNTGPSTANQIVVESVLHPTVGAISTSESDVCAIEENTVTCKVGDVIGGAVSEPILISGIATKSGEITNQASVTSSNIDPNISNNVSTASTMVFDVADFFTKIRPHDLDSGDKFGSALDIEGNTLVVGSPNHNNSSGAAYVFQRISGGWVLQQKLVASDGGDQVDVFGSSAAISGDTIVIGATLDYVDSVRTGSAYIFEKIGGAWIETAKLVASDGATNDNFGSRVAIQGSTAVVAATGDDGTSGSVYIFEQDGADWVEEQKLVASDASPVDVFGFALAIDGDTLVVGTPREDAAGSNAGAAYVFTRNGSWGELQKLTAGDASANDSFGQSVAIDQDIIVVGAADDVATNGSSGSAYIFQQSGSTWSETQKLVPNDGDDLDFFGGSVAMHQGNIVIGSSKDDDNGENSGSAYIFEMIGSNWVEQLKITPYDGAAEDTFGSVVGIYGNTVVVGSPRHPSFFSDAGAVYIYSISQAPPAIVTIQSPNDSLSYQSGASVVLQWESVGVDPLDSLSLFMRRDSLDTSITEPDGVNWLLFAEDTPNDGTESVIIPAGAAFADDWRFYVHHVESEAVDGSDFTSSIIDPSTAVDLAVSVTDLSDPVVFGESDLIRLVSVRNEGPNPASEVYLEVTLSPDSLFLSTNRPDICTNIGDWVSCTMDGLDVDESAPIIAIVSGATTGGTSFLRASVDSAEGDLDVTNNLVVEMTSVGNPNLNFETKLTASDPGEDDFFGFSVGIAAGRIAIGALGHDELGPNAGAVYAFAWNGTDWIEDEEINPSDADSGDQFGASLAMEGNKLVVGANRDAELDTLAGSAYVFESNGDFWIEQQKLLASDGGFRDHFGQSVAISGNTIVVGAAESSCGGCEGIEGAYVFEKADSMWSETQKLVPHDMVPEMDFGHDVAIQGNTIMVAAPKENSRGAVYAFDYGVTEWLESQKITSAADAAPSIRFGNAIDLGDGIMAVGTSGDLTDLGIISGSASVLEKILGRWIERQKIYPSDLDDNDQFGSSVSIAGSRLVTGAREGFRWGSAYISQRESGVWQERYRLSASDGILDNHFGVSVAQEDSIVVVGAFLDDHSGLENAGAAYVYDLEALQSAAVQLDSPDTAMVYLHGDEVTIGWTSFMLAPGESMLLEMKRDAAVELTEPDGINWILFTESTPDDGSELIEIPAGALLADDWRIYVRHVNSGALDTTDFTFTVIPNEVDLSVTKTDSVDPVFPEDTLVYGISVSNAGPATAENVVVTDTLPPGVTVVETVGCAEDPLGAPTCSLGVISAAGQKGYTLTVTVDPSTSGTITNQVNVTSSTPEANPGDEIATEQTTVVPVADLAVSVTDTPDPVLLGENVTYSISVSNLGPSDATGVSLTNSLLGSATTFVSVNQPDICSETGGVVTCDIGSLASSDTFPMVEVVATAEEIGTIISAADASGAESDFEPLNNTAQAQTQVVNPGDLIFLDSFESGDLSAWD